MEGWKAILTCLQRQEEKALAQPGRVLAAVNSGGLGIPTIQAE